MKERYIKFKEWDCEDLQRACKLAEKYWYKKLNDEIALSFEWTWILDCDKSWDYYTSIYDEQELKEIWYTELKEKSVDFKSIVEDFLWVCNGNDIVKTMRIWKEEHHNVYKSWEIFWQFFFKELERQLKK